MVEYTVLLGSHKVVKAKTRLRATAESYLTYVPNDASDPGPVCVNTKFWVNLIWFARKRRVHLQLDVSFSPDCRCQADSSSFAIAFCERLKISKIWSQLCLVPENVSLRDVLRTDLADTTFDVTFTYPQLDCRLSNLRTPTMVRDATLSCLRIVIQIGWSSRVSLDVLEYPKRSNFKLPPALPLCAPGLRQGCRLNDVNDILEAALVRTIDSTALTKRGLVSETDPSFVPLNCALPAFFQPRYIERLAGRACYIPFITRFLAAFVNGASIAPAIHAHLWMTMANACKETKATIRLSQTKNLATSSNEIPRVAQNPSKHDQSLEQWGMCGGHPGDTFLQEFDIDDDGPDDLFEHYEWCMQQGQAHLRINQRPMDHGVSAISKECIIDVDGNQNILLDEENSWTYCHDSTGPMPLEMSEVHHNLEVASWDAICDRKDVFEGLDQASALPACSDHNFAALLDEIPNRLLGNVDLLLTDESHGQPDCAGLWAEPMLVDDVV